MSGAYTVRLGDSASRQWIRARDKRPRHTVFRSVLVCICRYVVLPVNQKQVHDNDAKKKIADSDPEEIDPSVLPPAVLNAVEADSFWCLSRLLDGIQDNYITAQPGIQRSVKRMAELVARIDAPLSEHLAAQGVEFMQFAFRWMNCLLMREISVKNTVRMWDTYLVRPCSALDKSNDGWMDISLYTGGRSRCLFSIPPVRLFGVSHPLERKAPRDGLSGM